VSAGRRPPGLTGRDTTGCVGWMIAPGLSDRPSDLCMAHRASAGSL